MNLAEQILRRKHEAMYKQAASGVDAILTRDGRIRRVRRDTNRAGSMSDINVDLDL